VGGGIGNHGSARIKRMGRKRGEPRKNAEKACGRGKGD